MSHKVLIIDDEWMIARALSARLGAAGFEMHTASDGFSGIEAARKLLPDAILLDLRMPDIDGFEVLRRMRLEPSLGIIPVIILTANVQDTVRQEARVLGTAGFFCKPYDPELLIACLKRAISRKSVLSYGESS
ncbi:MAG: response regulator [Phycisphaeraceae bacterium]|nr:response regulator [Phycisphaeraceae bacterium]MCW5762540.1 response regulator [Phycisphaeraceae bacterium]